MTWKPDDDGGWDLWDGPVLLGWVRPSNRWQIRAYLGGTAGAADTLADAQAAVEAAVWAAQAERLVQL